MNIRRLQCFFSARSCSTSLSEICGTQGRASRKRLKLGVKPLISLILIIGILFSFSVSSYAASSFTYALSDFTLYSDIASDLVFDKPDIFSRRNHLSHSCTLLYYNPANDIKISAFQKISSGFKIGTSYTLTFSACKNFSGAFNASLYLTDKLDDLDNAFELAYIDSNELSTTSFKDYSIQVQYPDKFNGKQVYLVFMLFADKQQQSLYVTDFIFTDNDKSDEKIDGILEWLSAVYHSIVGGEDSRGVKHDGLVQGIKNGLTSLGNTIGGFFENLKISIENKIDAIQQWFVELGENIIDGIKSLFIPEDGYFESKKAELETFFSEHFGIVYTAGSLSIDVLKKFTSLKPPAQAVLHVPAWQMSLPWENDKVITIVPAMDVNFSEYINSSGVLHTFYKFYRAFITVVIIFMVVNYAKRKFDYVFGKDGEGVE